MADALAILGSRFDNDEGLVAPKIYFAKRDAPDGSLLPHISIEQVLLIEKYDAWYEPIVAFLARGRLPLDKDRS